jgi:GT2 family glycosyltransferase
VDASRVPPNDAISVLALVLTYNAPKNTAACVGALNAQTRAPASILVVDNAGDERVEPDELARKSAIPIDVMLLPENVGPAGGFAVGLGVAASRGCSAIWVMDDDVAPEKDCLEQLVHTWRTHGGRALVAPETFDAVTGESESGWGWWGILLPRELVEEVGLPRAELFYGFEDQDYLIDRSQRAGFELVRAPAARALRARRAPGTGWPDWQYYYMPRNATYQYLYKRVHIRLVQRLKRLVNFYFTWWGMNGEVRTGRVRKGALFALGIVDGLLGRLGRRVMPTDDRRPTLPSTAPPMSRKDSQRAQGGSASGS